MVACQPPIPVKPLSYAALDEHNGAAPGDNGGHGEGFEQARPAARQVPMKRRRVAIIGAGFSGVAVAANLAQRGRDAPDVLLIERSGSFGRGLAYSTKNQAHLLNVRASNMSAWSDGADDFAKWLKVKGGSPTTFASRKTYGDYAEHILREAERARFWRAVRRVRDEVVACRRADDSWDLELSSGKSLRADAVVLAIGHRAPSNLPVFEEGGIPLISAWDADALRRVPNGDVLLLGTGLTTVDIALSLSAGRRRGTIYALSRRGLLPRTHLDPPRPPQGDALQLPAELSEAVHAFRREVRAMAERGEPWQLAVDRMRAATPALWRRLTLDQQRRFLRHLRPWWDVHRHRAAPEIAARVNALLERGRLKVLQGEIVAAQRSGRTIAVQHRPRRSLVRHRLEVAAVINCTGGSLDYARETEPLIVQLIADGIVRPHANGLGLDVDALRRPIGANGASRENFFTIGPVTQGAFWESTAVPEIRVHAAAIAEML